MGDKHSCTESLLEEAYYVTALDHEDESGHYVLGYICEMKYLTSSPKATICTTAQGITGITKKSQNIVDISMSAHFVHFGGFLVVAKRLSVIFLIQFWAAVEFT